MAILSEKRQKCFGLRRKDVRMRAIICDDDGRFAKKLEQLIMQYYRNMGMTIDTTVVTNPQNLLKRNDLANFDIAFLDADMNFPFACPHCQIHVFINYVEATAVVIDKKVILR